MIQATKKALALHTLQVAIGYLGVSRATDPEQVTRFCNLLGFPFKDKGGKYTPFCNLGIGYSTTKAWCDLNKIAYTSANALQVFKGQVAAVGVAYFPLLASTHATRDAAIKRGVWIDREAARHTEIQPGWWVLYSWPDNGQPDHIELIELATSDTLHTVAFNTSDVSFRDGGGVARKERSWQHVLGFVQTY